MEQGGKFLVVLSDRLENSLGAQVRVQRPDFCPLIGHNPGSWLAFLLDITGEDVFS